MSVVVEADPVPRVDLAATCFLEKPSHLFPIPALPDSSDSPTAVLPWPIPPAMSQQQSIWKHSFQDDSPLLPIFHDLTTLVLSIKSNIQQQQDTGVAPVTVSLAEGISLIKGLEKISIPIEDIMTDDLVRECSRIAAILLINGIYEHSSSTGVPWNGPSTTNSFSLARKLHIILFKFKRYHEWVLLKPLLVWVLALGAVSSECPKDSDDFLDLILYAGKWLGLHSWTDALTIAGNLLWVGQIHDERFIRLTAEKAWKYNPEFARRDLVGE